MTDTGPPTNPGDISVNGQRRWPGGSFPSGGSGGSGDGPGRVLIGDDGGPLIVPDNVNPCDIPELRRDWNADAAAAEAKKEFERQAEARGDTGLYSREWYAFIYEAQDGSMYLGPVASGTINSVMPDTSGMTPNNLIGFIHNHPGGSLAPSGDDWAGFDSLHGWVSQWSSGGMTRANQLRQYIIARDTTDPNSQMAIRVFNSNSSRNADAPGPEVNPDGQPC